MTFDPGQYVKSLRYDAMTNPAFRYENPPPVTFETDDAKFSLVLGSLVIELKRDVKTPREARELIQPTLDAWEVEAAMNFGWNELKFKYVTAEVDYRNKQPGFVNGSIEILLEGAKLEARGTVIRMPRTAYPAPPPSSFKVTPNVRSLLDHLRRSEEGAEPLPGTAYFILTTFDAIGETQLGVGNSRDKAAASLRVDFDILKKLGDLSSTRGGPLEARKAKSKDLTAAERQWLSVTLRALIRRVGEIEGGGGPPLLTMKDLPPLRT